MTEAFSASSSPPPPSSSSSNGNSHSNSPASSSQQLPQKPRTLKVTRQAIAGLWRLTPQPIYPLKEFTVYPKPMRRHQKSSIITSSSSGGGWTRDRHKEELLLILNEDGSFQQYIDSLIIDDDEEEEEEDNDNDGKSVKRVDINDQWSRFQQQQQPQQPQPKNMDDVDDDASFVSLLSNQWAKGVWDFVDGKLILAADRASKQSSSNPDGRAAGESLLVSDTSHRCLGSTSSSSSSEPGSLNLDKLIVGQVVASSSMSSSAKPRTLQQQQPEPTTNTGSPQDPVATFSSHLSVPKGSLKMGKFFYPKHHPSFFDQPIYNPTTAHRRLELQQILGSRRSDDDADLSTSTAAAAANYKALLDRSNFYNKTFLLSSHALRQPQKNKPTTTLNPSLFQRRQESNEVVNPYAECSPIRVMQVQFFPNNTFCTVGGTGDVILRGKFDTFVRDPYTPFSRRRSSLLDRGSSSSSSSSPSPPLTVALWMQVMRFGFGRSVSGSVYSEGRSLTQDDAKTYWGTIRRVNVTVLGGAKNHYDPPLAADNNDDDTNNHQSYEDVVVLKSASSDHDGEIVNDPSSKDDDDNDDGDSSKENKDSRTVSILEVEGSVLLGTGVGAEPMGRFLMREMMQDWNSKEEEEEDDDEEEDDSDDDDEAEEDEIDLSSFTLPNFDKRNDEEEDADDFTNAFQ